MELNLDYICNHRNENIYKMWMFSSDILFEDDIERIKTTRTFVGIEDIINRFRSIINNPDSDNNRVTRAYTCLQHLYIVVHDNKDLHEYSIMTDTDKLSRCNTPEMHVE